MILSILLAFAGIIVVAALHPRLPVSRAMYRWLVEKPARLADGMTLLRAVAFALAIAATLPLIWILPAEIALVALMGDFALYYEAVLIAFVVSSHGRMSELIRAIRRAPRHAWRVVWFAGLAVRRRAARTGRRLRAAWRARKSDDEGGWAVRGAFGFAMSPV